MQPLHHYLGLADGRLHVLEWPSEGPTIVCQHYMWTAADVWADLFEALDGRFRVLSVDAPGHGESDHIDPEDRAETMLAVVNALAGGPAIFIGASNGGLRNTAFALRHPALVKRMVLVEPPILAKPDARDNERKRVALLPEAPRSFEELYSAYRKFIFPNADPALLETFLGRIWKEADGAWRQRLTISEIPGEINGFDLKPQTFARLDMPVLVVAGQNSRLCGPSGADSLRSTIRDCTAVVLPDCGHIVHVNQTPRLHQAIEDFCAPELGAVPSRRAVG
ncbi:MAG TPA: alpha/beta hydrolase [Burkholderiales bacterium]|nr:alpha/beta hydrolase [Burkholderiales bacterium]